MDPRIIEVGQISVRLRTLTGMPLTTPAFVRLTSRVGTIEMTKSTSEAAQADFRGIPAGEYNIQVTAAGYVPVTEEASLMVPNSIAQVYITMRPEGAPAGFAVPGTGPPILTPKAQKELDKAVEAMRANDLNAAQQALEKAVKLAPAHPQVHYLMGVYYLRMNDHAQARQSMQKAVSLDPGHALAQAGLGRLLLMDKDYAGAIAALEKSLAADPNVWENHALLATAYLRQQEVEKARQHATRAVDLSNGQAPQLRVLMADILVASGEKKEGARELEAFLKEHPQHAQAPAAQRKLDALRRELDGVPATEPRPTRQTEEAISVAARTDLPARDWAPPDVDSSVPAVSGTETCTLPALMAAVGRRSSTLAENLGRITAKEKVELAELDAGGREKYTQARTFEYMAAISQVRERMLSVEEWRDGSSAYDSFPIYLTTRGLVALTVIFHPFYVEDFDMRCEGLGQWRGQAVWSVRFQQKPGLESRVRVYNTNKGRFPVALKGRALIAANTYQVLRIETDLVAPMTEAQLEREHLVIDYAPVASQSRNLTLWLPARAELYAQFEGKRYRHRHEFSQFTFFSVETRQKIQDPKPPE